MTRDRADDAISRNKHAVVRRQLSSTRCRRRACQIV